MCSYRIIILFALGLFIVKGTNAQQSFDYPFRHIGQPDGLLHNEVLSVAQDRKGFIWIATRSGLQRYDGSAFIYYPDMLSNPLEGINFGAEIHADKINNRLWLTNLIKLEKLELGNYHFTMYDPDKLLNDSSFVFDTYRDEKNLTWLLGKNAVYYQDSLTKKKSLYRFNIIPANVHQTSFIVTDSLTNVTWVTPGSGLLLFDKKSGAVYSHNYNPLNHPLLNLSMSAKGEIATRSVMIDSRRNIWLTTWGNELYRFDQETKKISTYFLTAIKEKEQASGAPAVTPLVNCILEDDHHTIWVGTEHTGLLRYNPVKDNFDYCIAQEKNREGIRYDYKIFSLFQDKEQNIWVGTDKGINIFNPYRQYFKFIRHQENNRLSINKNEIISFIQITTGDIFIGTWGGGIAVYDSNFSFKKNIYFDGPPDVNKVWSVVQADEENVWIGCQHGYFIVYNFITGKSQTYQNAGMEASTIRCMRKDNRGNILFGLHNGKIAKWDKKMNQFFYYQNDNVKKMAPVADILIDGSKHCWVSTDAGFKEFDLGKMVYTNTWLPEKENAKSISGKTCQGIEFYNDSTLLIGTVNGGLNFFNKKTGTFSHVGIADGLPSNTIFAIKKDTAGFIWFTTDYGLYKFNPADKKIIPYSMEPGLVSSSFLSNKFYPLKDGRWLTFTLAEAISFFPSKSPGYVDDPQLKIEITGFLLYNKPLAIDSLLNVNKPLRLTYNENFFTIEFAALNFLSLHQTNYYYRLNGVDKDWVNGGNKRFANYTGLQPGKYFFEVKAENGNGGGQITSFIIIISPPFWQTWWFISLAVFWSLALIYFFIKEREKSIKTIAAEKLKVQQLSAEQYKSKLELEQITNYFASSLIDKNKVDDVLWDVAKNLIGRLGFVDCMIYLWNEDKTKMIQMAGFGPKGSIEEIHDRPFDVLPGQGVVGYVIEKKEPVLIPDTSKDSRYRTDEMERLSEITVPIIYNNELIGVIDSEHNEKNFYTIQHLQILSTIATLMATKIKSIEADQLLQQTQIEMYSINEQLSKARLEALRAQMNPHFIFNCLTSIDNLIQMDEKEKATLYLSKFARLIRSILENSINNTVPCWKDMETLQLYLELESLRFDNKFSYQVAIADEILNGDYKVPPLVIQPFVENAIHHGLLNKIEGEKNLLIHVSVINNQIHYLIEDNGVGRVKANAYKQLNKPSHQSMGMQITTDRINLFNQNKNGYVMITDLVNELQEPCGTKVAIELINQS
ncbi:MAG: two-component regulator propeller domain-containing protein [Ferruginibacter sp.]